MRIIAATLVAFLVLTLAVECADAEHTEATLSIHEQEGSVVGSFTLSFGEETTLYYPKRWGFSPTAGNWFTVRFESEDAGSFDLVPRTVLYKWPHPEDTQTFAAGDALSVEFRLEEDLPYRVRSADGLLVDRLPPGTYRVFAEYRVPDGGPARRCGLTIITAEAEPVTLVVPPG